jgi:hypothetical protein
MHTIVFKLLFIHNRLLRIAAKHLAIHKEMQYKA